MSLLDANAVLGCYRVGVGGVKANGLTEVGDGLAMVCWAPRQLLVVVVPGWDRVES